MVRRISNLYRGLFRKEELEQDLDAELQSCLEMMAEENVRRGMDAGEARRQARLELGGVEQTKEQVREVWPGALIRDVWNDLRYGARQLGRRPGATTVAVLSLALVIGANTTVFSVLNPILFYSLPYADWDRLVVLQETRRDQERAQGARPPTEQTYSEWRRQVEALEALARVTPVPQGVTITARGHSETAFMNRVSPSFFPLLGVKPQLGRTFGWEERSHQPGEPVLITDSYWRLRFGADPKVLGEQVIIAGHANIIVGVLPPDFRFRISLIPRKPDLWQSVNLDREPGTDRWLVPLGRLKAGVEAEQARLELDAIRKNLAERDSGPDDNWQTSVQLLPEVLFGGWRGTFYQLFGIALVVLLIGCANVANLLLANACRREKEISVRICLGAGHFRLVRQLLTESVLLASLGGVLGLLFTFWGIGIFVALAPEWWPFVQEEIHIDGRVLAFAAILSFTTGLVFGLIPAIRTSRANLHKSLKGGGRRSTTERPLLRNLLVVSEVSLTLILLVGSGLMVRSVINLYQEDLGYDPSNLLRAEIFLQGPKYWQRREAEGTGTRLGPQVDRFWETLIQRVVALPAVESAAVTGRVYPYCSVRTVGQAPPEKSQRPVVFYNSVSPGYFRHLGASVVRGRAFTEHDTEGARWVAVIDQAAAKRFFPEEDPLGRLIQVGFGGVGPSVDLEPVEETHFREIVGVVEEIKFGWASQPIPTVYVPHRQHEWDFPGQGSAASATRKQLLVRSTSNPLNLKPALEKVIAGIDPDQAAAYFRTEEQILADSIAYTRFWMRLFFCFGAVALLLVVAGVFGVISSLVGERVHEMGVRMALGAQRREIFVLVIKQGLRVTLTGLAVGIAISLALGRFLVSLRRLPVYEVDATDPLTYVLAALLLTVVALAACYFPARRATRVDPVVALKYE